jgi:hypothetical protein
MSRMIAPVVALVAAVGGVVALVPPALAAAAPAADASGPVDVSLAGSLETSGLADHATVSRLTVTNTGSHTLGWSLRPGSDGTTTAPVTLEYWAAGSAPCTAAAPRPASVPNLTAGSSVEVCVQMAATAALDDSSVPVVTVLAHPA